MGRRKDILLLVLAVVALAVAVYTFRRKPPPTAAQQPAAATAPVKSKTQVAKAGEAPKGAGPAGTGLPSSGATRNPFEGPGAGAAAAGAEAGKKPAGTSEKAPEGKWQRAPAPAVIQPPISPNATSPGATVQGTKAGKSQPSTLTLNGIVAGKQTMAVIREGDQRYYVKVGDRVGDRYRVQTITQKEVVLVGSEGKVILRMGGRQ
jgi:hypothetical protein